MRTINRVLKRYPGPHNNCNLEIKKTVPKPTAEETTRAPVTTTVSTTTTAVSVPYKPTKKKTTTRPRTTTTTVKSTTYEGEDYEDEYPDSDNDESCVDGSYFAHETDCGKYYICNHNTKTEQS